MNSTITQQELKSKIDHGDDFQLVETLPEEKFREAHLPGAVNLPPDRIRQLAAQVLPDRQREIVVYCGGPT